MERERGIPITHPSVWSIFYDCYITMGPRRTKRLRRYSPVAQSEIGAYLMWFGSMEGPVKESNE